MTDAENNKTSYVYDGFDRLSRTQYPSATRGAGTSNSSDYEELGYDAGSNVTSFRNRANETIGFSYDALGRRTAKDLPGSEPDVTYAYDLLGQMLSAATSSQTLAFGYDGLGRQLSQTQGSLVYSSQYDLAGRRTRITHTDGFYVDQDYLVTGEMVHIRENGASSGIGVLATYGYDDLGRRTSLTFGNGESASYSYDAVSRLSQLSHDLGGSATTNDLTLTFSYNPASQIVSTTRSNDLYAWTGHGSGSSTSTVDGLNRTTAQAGTSFSFDAKGNMTSDGIKTYAYDSENRQTSVNGSALRYDPLGRLSGAGTPLGITYDNYVDGLIAETRVGGSGVLYRHVFGPGSDEPIVWYNGSGTGDRRFLHADERGSIVAVTDASAGLLTRIAYDEYGKPQWTNPNYIGRFLYTGQRYFAGNGIYYYKNRIYDPRIGKFMQTDPIGYGGGMNLYAYVGGDPVNFTDPLGLDGCTGSRICHHDGGGSVQVFGDIGGYRGTERGSAASFGHEAAHASAESGVSNSNSGPGWYVTLTTYSNGALTVSDPFWKDGSDWLGSALAMLQTGGGGNAGNWDSPEAAELRWLRTHSQLIYRELTGGELPAGTVLTSNGQRLLVAEPTGSALLSDPYHRAAAFMRAEAAFFGRFTFARGNDGQMYLHNFLPGVIDGKQGNFHYIVDPQGRLTHQRFER